MSSPRIGLLGNSVSRDPGDQAITRVLRRLLARHSIPYAVVDPSNPDTTDIAALIIGGGDLIQRPGNACHRIFRARGKHLLNSVSIADAADTEYLDDYRLVTVRSNGDRKRLGRGDVYPCLSAAYGDYLNDGGSDSPVAEETQRLLEHLPAGAIGIHLTPSLRDHLAGIVHVLCSQWDGPVIWLPSLRMNDAQLLRALVAAVPNSQSVPPLDPDQHYRTIGHLRLLVTTEFPELSLALGQTIPIACFGYSASIGDYLRDRELDTAMLVDAVDLESRFKALISDKGDPEIAARDREKAKILAARIIATAADAIAEYQRKPMLFSLDAINTGAAADRAAAETLAAINATQAMLQQLQIRRSEAALDASNAMLAERSVFLNNWTSVQHSLRDDLAHTSSARQTLQLRVIRLEQDIDTLRANSLQNEQAAEQQRMRADSQSAATIAQLQQDLQQRQFDLAERTCERDELAQRAVTLATQIGRRSWLARIAETLRRASMPLWRWTRIAFGLTRTRPAAFPFAIDSDLATPRRIGNGTVVPISGWCFVLGERVIGLDLVAGDRTIPIRAHSLPRLDVFSSHFPRHDELGHSLLSGFQVDVPFAKDAIADSSTNGDVALTLHARVGNGDRLAMAVGTLHLLAGTGTAPQSIDWPDTGARIAIAMTTCDPPLELFATQIRSIIEQVHRNWICLIQDDGSSDNNFAAIEEIVSTDDRFRLLRNSQRLGFYRNFEACLARIPQDADFVALSDHDDRWNADKLASLLAAFDDETQLAFSDCRLVAPNGKILSPTFWSTRRNNFSDFATMLVANTVTGAASLFRRDLLDRILPFPERVADAYHDHWIALCAMAAGNLAYVERPLYDYMQHGQNVIGHSYVEPPGIGAAFCELFTAMRNPAKFTWTVSKMIHDGDVDFRLVQQKAMLANILLMRFPDMEQSKRHVLERFRQFPQSVLAVGGEVLRARREHRSTLKVEDQMLRGALATRLARPAYRWRRGVLMRGRLAQIEAASPFATTTIGIAAIETVRERVNALQFGSLSWVSHNISPLTLNISDQHPRRVNMLLATIDFRYVFGGYIGMFNLALQIRRMGHRVRFVLTESADYQPNEWRRQIRKFPGLESLFDEVEVASRHDRTEPLDVSPHDDFVATSCWSAHVAHAAMRTLERERFVFMVQEYEPIFTPHNSIHALFEQAYGFPQFDLFSTALLRDYFRSNRLGIYAETDGEPYNAVFHNALRQFSPARESMQHHHRRLLFYARPEDHAARNLFELGIMGLVALLKQKRFDTTRWSFHGIGSIDQRYTIELGEDVDLQLVPRTTLDEYIKLLPTFDVGMSLMLSPHPSLVPLEMAAAGLCSVTNTYANKTADALAAISSNLIAVPPTVEGIADGLYQAILRADDIDARLAGAKIDWPTSWNDAFADESMTKLREFLDH